MKGYKVFESDWTCRGFQYEVGKVYEHDGKIGLCEAGFHFCSKLIDCFSYYSFNPKNKVAEVEAIGKVVEGENKNVTNKIKIIRELSWYEVLDLVNLGMGNLGKGNVGDMNKGNFNIGNRNHGNSNIGHFNNRSCNTGDMNFGFCNKGHLNRGDYNYGNKNYGNFNIGNLNSGHDNLGSFNLGDSNLGECNKTNKSTGCFCTKSPYTIKFFNKDSDWTLVDWRESNAQYILLYKFDLNKWIDSESMTDEEKQEFYNLPNFDKDIFKEITGIDIEED